MCKLVAQKSAELFQQACSLLNDVEDEADDPWQSLWQLIRDVPPPQGIGNDLFRLMVISSLQSAAIWQFRFMQPCSSFPLLLFHVLNQFPDVQDHRRKEIAELLLATEDCCLRRINSDFIVKMKHVWREEFTEMARTGCCPHPLYSVLLIVRARLPLDTKCGGLQLRSTIDGAGRAVHETRSCFN